MDSFYREALDMLNNSGARYMVHRGVMEAETLTGLKAWQLLQNLIINAVKFSSLQPEIYISFKDDSEKYIFSVKDNGIGIDPEYFEKIFKMFQRLSVHEEYEGTGIGLAICKRIVERHGGEIWVESEQGKGATFYFSISKNEIK